MRKWQLVVVMFCAVASTLGPSSRAAACQVCNAALLCEDAPAGARWCLMGPLTCTMLTPCTAGGGRELPSEDGLTAFTLFDAPPGGPRNAPRAAPALRSEAGPIALGEEARASAGADAPTGLLADTELIFGEDFAISFVDAAGDGFALSRSREGGRVRIGVREVAHDVPGRLLANELLGPRDQLRVPVTVSGRARVLLLHATHRFGAGAALELPRLHRSLEQAGRVLPATGEPLLRAHAQ